MIIRHTLEGNSETEVSLFSVDPPPRSEYSVTWPSKDVVQIMSGLRGHHKHSNIHWLVVGNWYTTCRMSEREGERRKWEGKRERDKRRRREERGTRGEIERGKSKEREGRVKDRKGQGKEGKEREREGREGKEVILNFRHNKSAYLNSVQYTH